MIFARLFMLLLFERLFLLRINCSVKELGPGEVVLSHIPPESLFLEMIAGMAAVIIKNSWHSTYCVCHKDHVLNTRSSLMINHDEITQSIYIYRIIPQKEVTSQKKVSNVPVNFLFMM